MYNEPDKTSFFSDLRTRVVEYIQLRLELTKLNAFEKIAKILSYLMIAFFSAIFFLLALIFLSLMLSEYLNEIFQNKFLGYGITGGIYFLFFLIFLKAGKSFIGRRITDRIIQILFEKSNTESNSNG